MYTLGINAVYHDSAACLVKDGQVIAAVEEERFTHVKHGKRPIPFSTYELPFHAINYCLQEAGISLVDVDHVAYSYDPFLLLGSHRDDEVITLPLEPSAHPVPSEWESVWDPLFVSAIVNAPRHLASGVPHHLQARFRGARANGPYHWHFVEHHLAHAASAFLPSPFKGAAVLTLDGRGEKATTSYSVGEGNSLFRLGYEQLTEYLGFRPSSDEYKVMALASFGKPRYLSDFHEIIQVEANGQYTIQPLYLEERFGQPRLRGGPLEQRHYDIAHSLQLVLEETVLELTDFLGAPAQGEHIEFPLWPRDHEAAAALLEGTESPLIGLHPAARDATRRWALDRFAAAGTELHRRYGGTLVLLGEKDEQATGNALAQLVGKPCLNLVGKTSLTTLGAVIARLSVLVTNDTGPAHVAYALRTPTVTCLVRVARKGMGHCRMDHTAYWHTRWLAVHVTTSHVR